MSEITEKNKPANQEEQEDQRSEKHENQENEEKDSTDYIPSSIQEFLITIGGVSSFSFKFFKQLFRPPIEFREFLRQSYSLGVNSLFLVGLSGLIIGMVMTLQVRPTMRDFGAEAWIPSMISISIIREIGPVLTALICAGKVSSGIGAELGSMKVTEQIDAMTVSGAKPFNYLVVTRVLATTIMVPILVIYADFIALGGSYLAINLEREVTFDLFISQAFYALSFNDIIPAVIKTFFFGFAIGIVGCYKGYQASGGTVGVGNAANSAVVLSSLLIFIIDLVAVQLKQFFF